MTRGPAPKENAIRRNLHPGAQSLPATTQPGRELPKALGISTGGARRFWKTWSTAPQTAAWTETDWSELELTTKLVDGLYLGDLKLAGEIRQRVAKWGATVEDRARLRMTFDKTTETEPAASSVPAPEVDMDEELYKLLNGS
ncbi:phage terminase small subunit [Streptomyces vinaceus]|uniref:phage terminase small subunit n=1 Tax=Streptomyces vinaceus TaxID=1960 RepID=UPI004064353C